MGTPGPAHVPGPLCGTQPRSVDAALHVTLEPGKHGGGHRVSFAPVSGDAEKGPGPLGWTVGDGPRRALWVAVGSVLPRSRQLDARSEPGSALCPQVPSPLARWLSGSSWRGVPAA